MASEVTMEPVNIVETREGRILQVYPIASSLSDAFRPPVKAYAMCHIVDLDSFPYLSDENPKDLVKDIVQLGKFGILADPPELERRISVPWANVPFPGPSWALQHLPSDATEGDMWKLFSRLFRLDSTKGSEFWQHQSAVINLRKRILDEHVRKRWEISSSDWHLEFAIARDTRWAGGETTLPGGRNFLSQLPLQHACASIDTQSTNGTFRSSRPFLLFGNLVKHAFFTIEQGKAVHWDAEQGKEALDAFFSIDEGARRVCEISLADEGTRENAELATLSHSLFGKATTTTIGFGGFQTDTLARQFSVEELESHHLGQSLVHLDVPVGSTSLFVCAKDQDGGETSLMEEGVFVAG